MFENPRRSRQARNFTENDPKIIDLKSSSEQMIFRKFSLGAPVYLPPFISQILDFICRMVLSLAWHWKPAIEFRFIEINGHWTETIRYVYHQGKVQAQVFQAHVTISVECK